MSANHCMDMENRKLLNVLEPVLKDVFFFGMERCNLQSEYCNFLDST